MKTTRGYWNDAFRNEKGEDLQTCLEKYGWGVDRDHYAKVTVIFLDETRSFGYSWLLRNDIRDAFTRVRLYADDPCVRIRVVKLSTNHQH